MTEYQEKFQQLLRELFQFDCADLDFGIYRIMNYKREVVERFITHDLPQAISVELGRDALAEQSQAKQELVQKAQEVRNTLGPEALDAEGNLVGTCRKMPLGVQYLELQAKAAGAHSHQAMEATIYNYLYTFFSRYYQEGDFISKRRYSKRERYAIPYNGEEVYLYWANHDQYYIKTAENFTDYSYQAPNGVTVHFKLQTAEVEQDNVKGEKRFFLPRIDETAWDENAGELTIPFEYRPLTGQESITYGQKNQQDAINERAGTEIPKQNAKAPRALAALEAERRRDSQGNPVSYLEHHLRQYTRRNTSDFFIHKDLEGFLSRELDFYLKNEVLNLEEMESAGEELAEGWFQMLRLIKAVGKRIIAFLAQIENFQKTLWEKRKFITETFYCITLGQIDESFYPEIAANEAQRQEWMRLYRIDQLPDFPSPLRGEGRGEGQIISRHKEQRSALLTSFSREMRHAPTDAEKRLWYFLRDRKMGECKFRRQHPMGQYIVDFICIEARLIVELDGGQHNTPSGKERDRERTGWLEEQGFKVLRFWDNVVLKNTEGVLEAILNELEEAPHPNPLPTGEREVEFLKTHPTLVLDTRHFDTDFVDRLLASFENLDELTDGLLVHSENWQALNLLLEKYHEKVKCVYIDPPYNTGSDDFIYKDNYQHSSWMAMMKPRLQLAREWMRKNGVIFISIDDNEQPSLRNLLGQIYGFENFISTVLWQKVFSPKNTARHFSEDHDYILVYAKYSNDWRPNLIQRTEKANSRYSNPDNDPRGLWTSSDLTARNYYSEGQYEVVSPNGKRFHPAMGTYWRVSYRKFLEMDQEKLIWWGPDGSNMPRLKRFLSLVKKGIVPQTLWFYKDVGHTQDAKKELLSIVRFERTEDVLNTVKPVALIKRILQLTTTAENDNITLDFFAGSGITGCAAIELNREDGGRRKFILVEMADYFDTVLLQRLKKATFTPEWKEGQPKRQATAEEAARGSRIMKVIRLESYEDALNNISFDDPSGQVALRFDDYLLQYMLKWETRRSETLLNVEKLAKPFDYQLHIQRDGQTRAQAVDVPETFNYLLGLQVQTRRVIPDGERRYLVYRGLVDGRQVAVIWREIAGWEQGDYEQDKQFVAEHKLTEGADEVYVNGDSFIPGARALEPLFKARMFGEVAT